MAVSQFSSLLRSLSYLRDLDNDEIDRLAQELEPQTFRQGELIAQQGTQVRELLLIARGAVEIVRQTPAASQRLLTLEAGDTLGEMELAYRTSWPGSVRAIKPTTVLRWDRASLAAFLDRHPWAQSYFKAAARGRRLAAKLRFPWLSEDETIYALVRSHPIVLEQSLALPALFLLGAVALGWWVLSGGPIAWGWAAGGLAFLGILLAIWHMIDWSNDYYLVTNRRAVRQQKILGLYENRQETPLNMVLSISLSTDFMGRTLDFGDVIIRTYTGQIIFRNVAAPKVMARILDVQWRRAQLRSRKEDRETKEEVVRQLLEQLPTQDQGATPDELLSPVTAQTPEGEEVPRRWSFRVRIDEGGVITYRKHWAVLLQRISRPSLLIPLVAISIWARLQGTMAFVPFHVFLAVAVTLLLTLVIWWLYEAADWANDVYQITATQIVDLHRKPLSRETRKVAPLENILGTEVDRKGLWGIVLNYGNVIARVGIEQFVFEGVHNPGGVQQDITRAVNRLLDDKQNEERRQRRQELVEYLSIYHQQSSSRPSGKQPDRARKT